MDIVGPLPASQGSRYIFSIIDRSTRWPEAIPMTDASTESCAAALVDVWISRFGLPDQITSDRGSVFTSSLWTQLSHRLGISTNTTTAYNPEANGIVERFHRSLKASLMSRCSSENWKAELPWVMLGLRTAPKDDGHSPAMKVYGDNLTVPGDFFRQASDPPLPTSTMLSNALYLAAPPTTPTARCLCQTSSSSHRTSS